MSHTEILLPEGTTGRKLRDEYRFAAARRVGNLLEISGTTGHSPDLTLPEELADEVRVAFDNAEAVLTAAGLTWEAVYKLRTYHVTPDGARSIPEDSQGAVMEELAKRVPHPPVWTAAAVPALGLPGMRIEVEIYATF